MEVLHFFTALSVLLAASSLAERRLHVINELKNWTDARTYCREQHTDLVTISGMEDVTTLVGSVDVNALVQGNLAHRAWIGLFDDVNAWNWSLSDPNVFQNPSDTPFRNWHSGQPDNKQNSEFCVRIYDDGRWNDHSCTEYEKSVCADVNGLDVTFVLISEFKPWKDAQAYCRQHHTDLAFARDSAENEKIKQLMPPGQYAWIGLYRSPTRTWAWVDGSSFIFTNYWKGGEPNNNHELCAIANFDDDGRWEDCSCDWNFPFICYSDEPEKVPVSKHVVKLKVVKLSSVDLDDPAVLEDLLMTFEQKLKDNNVEGDIRLSWREQADGTTFHKDG